MKGFIFEEEETVCKLTVNGLSPNSTVGIFNQLDEPIFTGVVKGTELKLLVEPNDNITVVVRKPGIIPFRMDNISTANKETTVTIIVGGGSLKNVKPLKVYGG